MARNIVLTGAGRGLGQVMALALLDAGHRLLLTSTDDVSLNATRRISGAPDRAATLAADLADAESPQRIADAAAEFLGSVDMLINNAGVMDATRGGLLELGPEEVRRQFEVNTIAPLALVQHFAPAMVAAGWGRLVYVSTSLDNMLRAKGQPYGSTKAAGEAMMAALSDRLSDTGVTANVLLPGGPTATRLTNQIFDPSRMLQPAIMAPPVLWLASDASDGVTGRRIIAAKWDPACAPAEAGIYPIAWSGLGEPAIMPL